MSLSVCVEKGGGTQEAYIELIRRNFPCTDTTTGTRQYPSTPAAGCPGLGPFGPPRAALDALHFRSKSKELLHFWHPLRR